LAIGLAVLYRRRTRNRGSACSVTYAVIALASPWPRASFRGLHEHTEESPDRRRRPAGRRGGLSTPTSGSVGPRARRSRSRRSPRATSRHRVGVGKIPAEAVVNISADVMGRVTELAVNEGGHSEAGPVPPADRPPQPAEHAAAGRSGPSRPLPRSLSSSGRRVTARETSPRQREPQAAARSVDATADHARGARQGRRTRSRCASRRLRQAQPAAA